MRKTVSKSYQYIENLSAAENQASFNARAAAEKIGLGAISLSKTEAQILQFLLSSIDAKKVVEIGTLTGLSALYLLNAMPEKSFLWTLEKSSEHAAAAELILAEYIAQKKCKIVLGDAVTTLKEITNEGPFDAIFIDGNKAAYMEYFLWAIENVSSGGLIIADNVFLAGAVWGDQSQQKFNEKQVKVVQEMNQIAYSDGRLKSIIIPTEEGLLVCKKL